MKIVIEHWTGGRTVRTVNTWAEAADAIAWALWVKRLFQSIADGVDAVIE